MWLYLRLYWFMQYYALTSYEGFVGEETLDYNAVDVSTIHAAKGSAVAGCFHAGTHLQALPLQRNWESAGHLVPRSCSTGHATRGQRRTKQGSATSR